MLMLFLEEEKGGRGKGEEKQGKGKNTAKLKWHSLNIKQY